MFKPGDIIRLKNDVNWKLEVIFCSVPYNMYYLKYKSREIVLTRTEVEQFYELDKKFVYRRSR